MTSECLPSYAARAVQFISLHMQHSAFCAHRVCVLWNPSLINCNAVLFVHLLLHMYTCIPQDSVISDHYDMISSSMLPSNVHTYCTQHPCVKNFDTLHKYFIRVKFSHYSHYYCTRNFFRAKLLTLQVIIENFNGENIPTW